MYGTAFQLHRGHSTEAMPQGVNKVSRAVRPPEAASRAWHPAAQAGRAAVAASLSFFFWLPLIAKEAKPATMQRIPESAKAGA